MKGNILMGKPRRIPTSEEYEKDKQIILNAYKEGLPLRRMLAKFDYTRTYIAKMKETLINEGLLTEEEIKSALAKYLKENPASQGLDKSRARKPKGTEKAERRHSKCIENKEKVFELVKQKYTKAQIARKLKITPTNVDWYIKELIEEGKVRSDEIEKGSNGSDNDIIDKNAPEYLELREQVVQCLKKGWKNFYIRKVLNITPYDFDIYIRDIKRKKIMTAEEIKKAREGKYQEDLKFVANSINDGLSTAEIRELKPEFTANEITPMIKELINAGVISQEKVDENAKNGRKRTINKDVELSPEEQVQFILDKIKKGYTPTEIVESDKTKSITMHKVLYQKRQLIAKKIIPEEEADKAMKERQKEALAKKHEKIIKEIKKYTELGYTLIEISEFITEYTYHSLDGIKNAYIRENGWYTEQELKKFVALRKLREFENLSAEEKKRIEEERIAEAKRLEEEKRKRQEEIMAKRKERKARTDLRHQEDAKILKEHIKSGKTIEEAAGLMKFSVAYAYKIRKESIQNNTWLSLEELKVIEKKKEQILEKVREERRQQKIDEQNRKKEENELRIKKEVMKLREYVKQGYTYKEISENMCYGVAHLDYLRKLAIAEDIWFTRKDIKNFRNLREKREALEKEKIRKEEQKRLDKERKAIEKAMREEEAIKKAERKRKIKDYEKIYKICKKEAKREDKFELDGEEDVSTEGRRKFIKILIALHSLEVDISDQDIEIVINTFYIHPELANKDSVKFLISDATRKGGRKSAEKMIAELVDTLRDTKFYKPLIEYKRWIRKLNLLPQIRVMKEEGLDNSQVAEKLGISSAEVSILLNNDKDQIFEGIGVGS